MIKSIIYKEWLKLRLFWGLATTVHIGLIAYILLKLRNTLISSGTVETWATMIGRDMLMINQLMFVPLITGLVLALCQWLPEMQIRRIRLTLHLPIDYTLSIGTMLLSSIGGMCLLFTTDAAILAAIQQIWLPRELVWRSFLTIQPWYISALLAYFVASWVILEPQWSVRCVNVLIGTPLVALCFLTSQPACYTAMIPWFGVLLVVTAGLPFYSIYRFKLGKL